MIDFFSLYLSTSQLKYIEIYLQNKYSEEEESGKGKI